MGSIIYFDTESTGVKTDKDLIIEIAAYNPLTQRSFCSLVNPGIPIPEESVAICNITDAMVKEAPNFKKIGEDFINFCGPDAVLIAHNCDRFDKPLLETEAKRHGLELPSWKYIDTLKWSRKYRPDLPSHSLQNLREHFGIPANQAHRALDDVYMLHKIFSFFFDDLPIETILRLLYEKETLERMPFGKYQGKLFSEVPKSYLRWLQESGALEKAENSSLKEALASFL